ncbi:MAG: cytochrome b/b6 domain-containing protein [Pararhodobacter sp.]
MANGMQRYARTQIIVHWVTLILLLGSFVSHEAMNDAWRLIRQGTQEFTPDVGVRAHVIIGILVLVMTVLRIVLRLRHGAPAQPAAQGRALAIAAAAVHGLLYILLLAIPLSGMAAWFGGITDLGEVHEVLFNLALALVGLHVLAAAYHQFVIRDNLIARMTLR